jgi:RimJ/RimL family protein N-acetyltransferase
MDFGYWCIVEKMSGNYVGEAGFADFQRAIDPPFGAAPEIGWSFVSAAHGRGYATEVVQALTAWSDAYLPAPRTVCMINPENTASIKVAGRCGYTEFENTTYHGVTTLLFERFSKPPLI